MLTNTTAPPLYEHLPGRTRIAIYLFSGACISKQIAAESFGVHDLVPRIAELRNQYGWQIKRGDMKGESVYHLDFNQSIRSRY